MASFTDVGKSLKSTAPENLKVFSLVKREQTPNSIKPESNPGHIVGGEHYAIPTRRLCNRIYNHKQGKTLR